MVSQLARLMSPSATPAMQSEGGRRLRATPATQSAAPATQSAAASPRDQRGQSGAQARHQTQPSARSAMLATQNESGCREVPPLMSPSAMPPRQSEGGCRQRLPRKVPRRHRATSGAQARHRSQPSDVSATRACHAKRRWMPCSATPATQNEGGSRQVPRV